MYRSFLISFSAALAANAFAQSTVHQVVVLSEGRYDYINSLQLVPVTVGVYDPVGGTYTGVIQIDGARFGNDVKVENELIYVSADTLLLKYDANTFALLDQETVHGIRRLALWNDQLVITRAELGGLPHYFEVRDKHTFDLLYTIDPGEGIPYTCEAVEVLGDKAYIAMNNGFNWPDYTNLIGVVDLQTQSFEAPIDLGPDGYNPEHLMTWEGSVYAFNNKDYTGSSISRIDPANGSLLSTTNVAFSSGCGTSTAAADKIYYMEYAVNQLARYDLASEQVLDTLDNNLSAYGVLGDPINNVLYVTTTDFVSAGGFYVTEHDGNVLHEVPAGISSGKMALDIRMSTGVEDGPSTGPGRQIEVFPNPVTDELAVRLPGNTSTPIIISDAMGRTVHAAIQTGTTVQRIDVSPFAPGVYNLRAGDATVRFTKQ